MRDWAVYGLLSYLVQYSAYVEGETDGTKTQLCATMKEGGYRVEEWERVQTRLAFIISYRTSLYPADGWRLYLAALAEAEIGSLEYAPYRCHVMHFLCGPCVYARSRPHYCSTTGRGHRAPVIRCWLPVVTYVDHQQVQCLEGRGLILVVAFCMT